MKSITTTSIKKGFSLFISMTTLCFAVLLPAEVSAATQKVPIHNDVDSAYRISVYSKNGCKGTKKTVKVGSKALGKSYRVNAYSDYRVITPIVALVDEYGPFSLNRCVTVRAGSGQYVIVRNYPTH